MLRRLFLLFIFPLLGVSGVLSEDKDPLIIKHADSFEYLDRGGVKIQKLVGHVSIQYKDAHIQSDTAIHYYTLDKIDFIRRVRLDYDAQCIYADRLVYYKKDTLVEARGNVALVDSVKRVRITGEEGTYSNVTQESRIWRDPVLTRADSLKGDTLKITAAFFTYSRKTRCALAQDKVVVTQGITRALCAQAEYDANGESVTLRKKPVVYRDKDVLKGDTLTLGFRKDTLDCIRVFGSAEAYLFSENKEHPDSTLRTHVTGDTLFVFLKNDSISRMELYGHGLVKSCRAGDSLNVDRLSGKQLYFFFSGNRPDSAHITGNAESVYFSRDNPKERGRNETSGDSLDLYFNRDGISRILARGGVRGIYYQE
ncbi:MAG: OstA-like protein [Fibrobacterota bacterium]